MSKCIRGQTWRSLHGGGRSFSSVCPTGKLPRLWPVEVHNLRGRISGNTHLPVHVGQPVELALHHPGWMNSLDTSWSIEARADWVMNELWLDCYNGLNAMCPVSPTISNKYLYMNVLYSATSPRRLMRSLDAAISYNFDLYSLVSWLYHPTIHSVWWPYTLGSGPTQCGDYTLWWLRFMVTVYTLCGDSALGTVAVGPLPCLVRQDM